MALVRVVPLKNFLDTALSTTAPGTAYSTEAPVAGQTLYAGLHLTAVSTGRTLLMRVQSASSSGFGAVTTEISFSATTFVGATMASLANPSTDRPWRRAIWTLSTSASTGGSWNGLVYAGLQ